MLQCGILPLVGSGDEAQIGRGRLTRSSSSSLGKRCEFLRASEPYNAQTHSSTRMRGAQKDTQTDAMFTQMKHRWTHTRALVCVKYGVDENQEVGDGLHRYDCLHFVVDALSVRA